MSIGQRLKEIRKKTGLSVANFADTLGEKEYKIRDSEAEKQKISNDLLEKIGLSYNVDLNWLLTGKGTMYLEEKEEKRTPQHTTGDHNIVTGGSINGNISINTTHFNHAHDIKEIIELLQYAPSGFLDNIKKKLQQFKELSQL